MGTFRIMPHGRLQEWVAEEKGYYADEGLDYEFVHGSSLLRSTVQTSEGAPIEIKQGAFESMESGRACDISSACHWAVNMASSAEHGRMYGHAYSVTPAGIYVAPESPVRRLADLTSIEIGVGYHSGSHFSALQALLKLFPVEQLRLKFIGSPAERLDLLLERRIDAVNIFGVQREIAEQYGFRKVLDTTFMIGFLIQSDASDEDVQKYFRALQRAQRDIDLEPEQYKHYFLSDVPEKYRASIDVQNFTPAERIVFEPYTREMYEKTHRWMESLSLFPEDQTGNASYEQAIAVLA